MTAQEFCYWLQGYIEIQNPKEMNETQVQIIKDHLKLVFEKITPERNMEVKAPENYFVTYKNPMSC